MKAKLILLSVFSCLFVMACEKPEEITPDQMKKISEDATHYRVIENILGTNKGVVITYDTIGQIDSVYLKQGPVKGNYKLTKVELTQIAQYKNAMIGLDTNGVLYIAVAKNDAASPFVYTKIPMDNPATIVSFSVNGDNIEATDSYKNRHMYVGSKDSRVSIEAWFSELSQMFGTTIGSKAVEIDKSNPKGKDIKLTEVKKY